MPTDCCNKNIVFRDAVYPVALEVRIERRNLNVDLSTAVSAFFSVHKPDATEHVWFATIAEKQESYVVLQYAFVAGDVPLVGTYALFPKIALPGGTFPAIPVEFDVVEYWSN